jgi:hypothetical protein
MTTRNRNLTIAGFIAIFGIGIFIISFAIFSQTVGKKSVIQPALNTKTLPLSTTELPQTKPAVIPAKAIPDSTQVTPPAPISTSTSSANTQINTATETGSKTTTSVVTTTTNKNGKYSFDLSYKVPKGNTERLISEIEVTNDVITGLKNTHTATNRDSKEYQASFETKIQSAVVGKKISDLDLSQVGGASLTTNAFTQGLAQIQEQSKR